MKYDLSPKTSRLPSDARRRAKFARAMTGDAFGRRVPHPSTDSFVDRPPHVPPLTIADIGRRGR